MVVEIIRYNITPESAEQLIQAYKKAGTYLTMQGFRTGPDFQPFFALVRPFFNAVLEMKHYSVSVKGAR
jgi:hypothetical protein